MRRVGAALAVATLVTVAFVGTADATHPKKLLAPPVYKKQSVAKGTGGAVASMDLNASKAGIQVLQAGGNAVDAAVATASTLGDTIPFVAGPGGGGFMVIYLAKSHKVVTINGRETCPAACTSGMFTDPKTGKPQDYNYESEQPVSTGVPGMVATWAKATQLYGRLKLATDLVPAIAVGEHGFRTNFDFQQLEQSGLGVLRAYTASRKLLLTGRRSDIPSPDTQAETTQ